MSTESPTTPTFATESSRSPSVLEKATAIGKSLKERVVNGQEKKKSKAVFTPAKVESMKDERKTINRSLNVMEDPQYKAKVEEHKRNALEGKYLQREALGNRIALSPAEIARAQSDAYNEFAQENPTDAEWYRANGIHFDKPDKKGNVRIDTRADPFVRAVDNRAFALKKAGDEEGAQEEWDKFARECPDKATLYALQGHKDLKKAVERVGTSQVATRAEAIAKTTEAPAPAAATQESDTQITTDATKYKELHDKGFGSLSTAEKVEYKKLRGKYKARITDAQTTYAKLNDEANEDVPTDEQVKNMKTFDAFIDKEQPEKKETQKGEVKDDTKARSEEYQKQHGAGSLGELKALGIDLNTTTEEQALQICHVKGWNGPDDENKAFIHAGFVEHQNQVADEAVAALPDEIKGRKIKIGELEIDPKEAFLLIIALLGTSGLQTVLSGLNTSRE